MRHEQHECNTSRHQRYTNDTSVTRVKNFDFDDETSEKIFSHPYITDMANERLQGKEQLHSKNFLLEMHRSHAEMHRSHFSNAKSAPQKLNFVIAKAVCKSYTLECSCKYPCTFSHSNA